MRNTTNNNPNTQIFNDLEKFLDFCRDFGYKYDESNLYNMRSFVYQQFSKYMAGKSAKNMWAEDARKHEQSFAGA